MKVNATNWLTAPGVTQSSAAAFFTERWPALVSKARNALSGGRRPII
jgi:hypothetical protein